MLTGLIQPGIDYDVTADGQRFLIATLVGEAAPASVILNWAGSGEAMMLVVPILQAES